MADISTFRRDTTAAKAGVLVSPGPEWGDMQLRVRPAGTAYDDALSRAKADAVRQARADGRLKPREGYENLPLSERTALGNRICLQMLLVDVVNLTSGGQPVSVADFRDMAQTEEMGELMDATWAAVEIATSQRRVTTEAAAGNSPASSVTTSNGVHQPA